MATVFIVIAAGVVSLPTFRDLYSISKMKEQYLVDDAVHSQLGPKEATAEEMLNPPFMKKYGLSMSEYLDEDGYFSPKGFHWKRWNIETRTAAILMWRKGDYPSAWKIRNVMGCVDGYYSRNDDSVAVMKVVDACFAQ